MFYVSSDVPMPFTSAGQPDKPVFLSSKETSSIIIEKKDEITASLGASSSSRMIDSSSRSMHDAADAAVQSTDVMAAAAAAATTSAAADASKTAVNMTRVVCIYTVSQKKQDTKLLPVTSPNVNRFSKFFHS